MTASVFIEPWKRVRGPPGGRPAEHLNTPRCFVSFQNGRKNYSSGMTYHPSGALTVRPR